MMIWPRLDSADLTCILLIIYIQILLRVPRLWMSAISEVRWAAILDYIHLYVISFSFSLVLSIYRLIGESLDSPMQNNKSFLVASLIYKQILLITTAEISAAEPRRRPPKPSLPRRRTSCMSSFPHPHGTPLLPP